MDLWGPLRLVLKSLEDIQGDSPAFHSDRAISQKARMPLKNVQNCLVLLHENDFISLSKLEDGFGASIEAKGRTVLTYPSSTSFIPISSPKVVPKGLRPFGPGDSDFFLELLPGTPDGRGLPESIFYWKDRIEGAVPGKSFRVGIIFGPSGCGKSSLIRAGLLPALADHVLPLYLEATFDKTESSILEGLKESCPEASGGSLVEIISSLGTGTGLPAGKSKVLIVIDQFEQWLHAHRSGHGREVVDCLKKCNGTQAQAIISVRADFYLASARFMAELGVEMQQGSNWATMDLFGERHARKVLKLFGQAYGALPADDEKMTVEQQEFLIESVRELATEDDDGRIAPVRLSLFAQMLSEKEWTAGTLLTVGGAKGVGVRFLEETFDTEGGRMRYNIGQNDLRPCHSILKALLPELGTSIKGGTKSEEELLAASGCDHNQERFRGLISLLDGDLRLITPTQRNEGSDVAPDKETTAVRYYQLTHDYLVPSVRDWLTRKQLETRRGRAALSLAVRSPIWNARPENRYLPSALEWAKISLLTNKNTWTDAQRKMMRRAGWVHGVRGLVALLMLVAAAATGLVTRRIVIKNERSTYATGLVRRLFDANTAQVPTIVSAMRDYRTLVDHELRREYAKSPYRSSTKLHASLALLPDDAAQIEYLFDRMLHAEPTELLVLRDALQPHRAQLIPRLWSVLASADPDESPLRPTDKELVAGPRSHGGVRLRTPNDVRLLPVASALDLYDPVNPRWEKVGDKVAEALVSTNSVHLGDWLECLTEMRGKLNRPLARIFKRIDLSDSERTQVTNILTYYASDDLDLLVDLLLDAGEKPFAVLFNALKAQEERAISLIETELSKAKRAASRANDLEKDQLARRQARAAVALVRLEQGEKVWHLLRHSADPTVRSYIVTWLKPLGAEPRQLKTRLESLAHAPIPIPKDGKSSMDAILFHPQTSERRALILALGGFDIEDLVASGQQALTSQLLETYRNDPDAGIHGASEWALRQWKNDERLKEIDVTLSKLNDWGGRRWFVNCVGQTFTVIDGPVEFMMGSPPTEPDRDSDETPHRVAIPRRFAIAAEEVSKEQWQAFVKLHPEWDIDPAHVNRLSPDPNGPMIGFSWYIAAAFCNWLSEQERLPKDQWCYLPAHGNYATGMTIAADVLRRKGYRLPTEAEWEYACRSGTATSRYYGRSLDLLDGNARYRANSQNHAWTCGSLRPNDLGFFDLLGNVHEWVQDQANGYTVQSLSDDLNRLSRVDETPRLVRGGSVFTLPAFVRSAFRVAYAPGNRLTDIGFRPARTYP